MLRSHASPTHSSAAQTAALVSLFVLPPDPVRLLATRIHALHAELAHVLSHVADGLRGQDADHLATCLERARATDELVAALHAARPVAAEVARFVPVRRRARESVARLDAGAVPLDHAVRNTRVLARSALALLPADREIRDECAAAIALLGAAVRRLDPTKHDQGNGHDPAGRAAERLDAIHAQSPSPALGAIAAASRGIADDLAPPARPLRRAPADCSSNPADHWVLAPGPVPDHRRKVRK